MRDTFKILKMAMIMIGLVSFERLCIAGDLNADAKAISQPAANNEMKMADAIVFPNPEKSVVSLDPFLPLATDVEAPQNIQGELIDEEELNISDLKIKGIMIRGDKASVLIQAGHVINMYKKGDMVLGHVIKDITTKGVDFEKNGNEVLLEVAAR